MVDMCASKTKQPPDLVTLDGRLLTLHVSLTLGVFCFVFEFVIVLTHRKAERTRRRQTKPTHADAHTQRTSTINFL